MIRRLTFPVLALFVIGIGQSLALGKKPADEVLGLRLGMNEGAARKRLSKMATMQPEEGRKKQQVWILRDNSTHSYLITRFKNNQLVFVTAVVHPQARVRYANLGAIEEAATGNDGQNYTYKWKVAARGNRPGYFVVARGSNADFLTSYSLYTSP